jgi:hypothetical protein
VANRPDFKKREAPVHREDKYRPHEEKEDISPLLIFHDP